MPPEPPGAASPARRVSTRFRLRSDEREVRRALRRIVAHFSDDLSADDRGTVELVLAEVLNNIVEHAYARAAPGPIRLFLTAVPNGLLCRIEDDGRPMPSLALPDGRLPDAVPGADRLPEGGWGWGLIRSLTADLAYERTPRCNRLQLRVPVGWSNRDRAGTIAAGPESRRTRTG